MDEHNFIEIPIFKFALNEGLSDDFLPIKGSERATGWDVKCASNEDGLGLEIKPGEYVKIPLGFRVFAPFGWWLELRPRSSTFGKKHLHALYGVIDEDYEGQCLFACHLPKSEQPLQLQFGESIGQVIPVRRQEMVIERVTNEEYEKICKERNTSRGQGGFGSTGR